MSLSRERYLASTYSSILSKRLKELILLVLRSGFYERFTLLLLLKDFLNQGSLRQVDFMFFDVSQDGVNFVDDFFASFDGIEEGFMEVVRGSINELYKVILGDSVYHIVGILLGDMHVIVFHLGASEDGHGR